ERDDKRARVAEAAFGRGNGGEERVVEEEGEGVGALAVRMEDRVRDCRRNDLGRAGGRGPHRHREQRGPEHVPTVLEHDRLLAMSDRNWGNETAREQARCRKKRTTRGVRAVHERGTVWTCSEPSRDARACAASDPGARAGGHVRTSARIVAAR